MCESKESRQFLEYLIFEVFFMIIHKLFGNTEPQDDTIKGKTSEGVSGVVDCGHGFDPLGKIVNYNNDVLVTILGWHVTSHKFNAPFADAACNNDGM